MKNISRFKLNRFLLLLWLLLGAAACVSLPQSSPAPRGPAASGPPNSSSGPSAAQFFQQGLDLFRQFKYQEAKGSFDGAIGKDPNHFEAFYYRARTLLELKQTRCCRPGFQQMPAVESQLCLWLCGKSTDLHAE